MNGPTSRSDCEKLDAADPLATLRDQFLLPEDVIYLDGNSLGALPRATSAKVAEVIEQEWGVGLIRSWNAAEWTQAPQRVGDRIARLIGAGPGEVVVADSTTVNLYKVLWAALANAAAHPTTAEEGRVLLADASAFPSDLYIANSVATAHGVQIEVVEPQQLTDHLRPEVTAVLMNHVDYRSGAQHDLVGLTQEIHAVGAAAVWDLAHSAGAVPVDVTAAGVDFAVGCGYKYLNGGPGAPAFVWVNPRLVATATQPLTGWFGHAAPFAFETTYRPTDDIRRFLCGTPPVLALAALEVGVECLLAAEPFGGVTALYAKSLALTDLMKSLMAQRCPQLECLTPPGPRGSQLAFRHPENAFAVVQCAIENAVIGDFRSPDVIRLAVTPLYTRYTDVWDAVDRIAEVLHTEQWREPRFAVRGLVT